ncbi:DUF131 domain-containing protein [Candidatus Bathyarchaeota archaeon]|nr:DUF131 domain-containing protein [Candidatus Bathyarchaeota archaeon]
MGSSDKENCEIVEESETVSRWFFLLLILGFALVVFGVALILVATVFYGGSSASGGAVIFVGPFPIVIGTGSDVTWIVLFSTVLIVLSVVIFFVMNRKRRKRED